MGSVNSITRWNENDATIRQIIHVDRIQTPKMQTQITIKIKTIAIVHLWWFQNRWACNVFDSFISPYLSSIHIQNMRAVAVSITAWFNVTCSILVVIFKRASFHASCRVIGMYQEWSCWYPKCDIVYPGQLEYISLNSNVKCFIRFSPAGCGGLKRRKGWNYSWTKLIIPSFYDIYYICVLLRTSLVPPTIKSLKIRHPHTHTHTPDTHTPTQNKTIGNWGKSKGVSYSFEGKTRIWRLWASLLLLHTASRRSWRLWASSSLSHLLQRVAQLTCSFRG